MTYEEQLSAIGQAADAEVAGLSANVTSLQSDLEAAQAHAADLQKQLDALQPPNKIKFLVGAAIGGNADPAATFEPALGNTLMGHRMYFRQGRERDGSLAAWVAKDLAAGREPHHSTAPTVSDSPHWAAMASGLSDTWLRAELTKCQQACVTAGPNAKAVIIWNSEPEKPIIAGSKMSDFAASLRRFCQIASEFDRLEPAACLMGYHEFSGPLDMPIDSMIPPDVARMLKVFGIDPYQKYGVKKADGTVNKTWTDFEPVCQKMRAWADRVNPGLRMGFFETGVWELAIKDKPGYFAELRALLTKYGLSFYDYFNSNGGDVGGWALGTSGIRFDAYQTDLEAVAA